MGELVARGSAVNEAAKKVPAKKVPAKKANKKVPAKKAPAKKAPAKKVPAKKAAKKASAKKAASKKATAAQPTMGLPELPAPPTDPAVVLGLTEPFTAAQLRRAWRSHASRHHPDQGGDAATFARGRAAYEALLARTRTSPRD
ncbi:hypothetical protein [Mycolicibacterium sp. 050158]|uniref:hypothetical protein n=1 Tax=Mycolicibacterium sp. 050158 TaxID=3090602 RepID=UPI00299D8CFA|nr:hypothetical protein [Mycolicibacterium sp. 050158]MDX1890730.1 hypothetical protein [Mycolicibacterium sp. 050158]